MNTKLSAMKYFRSFVWGAVPLRWPGLAIGLCMGLLVLAACAQPDSAASLPPPTATEPSAPAALDTPPLTTTAVLDVPALSMEMAAPTAAPTPIHQSFRADQPVRLVIEALDMDRSLIQVGLDANRIPIVPRHDVGWYEYSASPGSGDNIVLWGHVLRFLDAPDIPAPFARLDTLALGETIEIYTANGNHYQYTISEQIWATPEQVEYILPQGEERLTLVSCIGEKVIVNNATQMSHRLITIARPL